MWYELEIMWAAHLYSEPVRAQHDKGLDSILSQMFEPLSYHGAVIFSPWKQYSVSMTVIWNNNNNNNFN